MNYNSINNLKINSYNDLDYFTKNNVNSIVNQDKSLLINKNIDNYFNEIINTKEPIKTYKIINKNNSFFSRIYKDYFENNMLLIFVLFIIIIFLALRYYSKNYNSDNEHFNNNTKIKENLLYKKKMIREKNNLKKYKQKLENEKKKIIDIIDELSTINYEIDTPDLNKNISYNKVDGNSIGLSYKPTLEKSSNSNKHMIQNNKSNFDQNKKNLIKNVSNKISNFDSYNNFNDNSNDNFYDINRNLNDNDLIDGVYIEPPFI
jgi:hypothetical protein